MTMSFLVLLQFVFFVLHEMEEIISIEIWYRKHESKVQKIWPTRKPFGLDRYGNDFRQKNVTANIAFAISFQIVFMALLSIFSVLLDGYLVWYGAMLGSLIMSTFIHVRLAIQFRSYTPGFITTLILLVPMIWVFYEATVLMQYGILEIILSTVLVNVLSALIVFQILHRLVKVTNKLFHEPVQQDQ